MTDPVFVFGSNLAGRHGKGAALFARHNRGAVVGQAAGRQGNSYAIPTKDKQLRPLPLPVIRDYVATFVAYAGATPAEQFQLTPIGCGLAGFSPSEIAPMFEGVPPNVLVPDEFKPFLTHPKRTPSCTDFSG